MKACVSVCMESIGLEISECKVVEGSKKKKKKPVPSTHYYCTVSW